MVNRETPLFQLLCLPALLFLFIIHFAYTADISASKANVKKYLKEIAETDKKISLTEDELSVLHSDLEKTKPDSITREKTLREKIQSLKKEAAHLDSLEKKNEA